MDKIEKIKFLRLHSGISLDEAKELLQKFSLPEDALEFWKSKPENKIRFETYNNVNKLDDFCTEIKAEFWNNYKDVKLRQASTSVWETDNRIKKFMHATEEVLNSRSLLLVFDDIELQKGLSEQQTIKELILSPLFDIKLLQSDLLQQDGDFFHPYSKGSYFPVQHFPKKSEMIAIDKMENSAAFQYLMSMLTANNKPFSSPYQKGIPDEKARQIVKAFLAGLTKGRDFRFYKLQTDFIFFEKESCYWDCLGSDAVSVIMTDKILAFIFTNGSD